MPPPPPKDSLSGVETCFLLLAGWKYQAILGDTLPASVLAEIRPSPLSPSATAAETAAAWRWGVENGARNILDSAQQAGEGLVVGWGEWPGNRTCRGGSLGGVTSLPGWRGLKIKFLLEGVASASCSHLADEAAGWTGLGASEGPPQTSGAPQACQASGPPWPVESEPALSNRILVCMSRCGWRGQGSLGTGPAEPSFHSSDPVRPVLREGRPYTDLRISRPVSRPHPRISGWS